MTLNEKLEEATEGWRVVDRCEEIADEFAIGFAEWCFKNGIFTQLKITQKATKELLEIYKKEKGL